MVNGTWPTGNIFACYRPGYGLTSEAGEGIERIGVYTFRFTADGSGVVIQRNIFGKKPKEARLMPEDAERRQKM